MNYHISQQPDAPAFLIGSYPIQWYGIFFALGLLFAIFFIIVKLHFYYKVNDTPFYIFIFIAIPTIILGAHVWSYIIGDFKGPFFSVNGFSGLAIQGGVIFCSIVGIIWFTLITKRPSYFVNTTDKVIKNGILTTQNVSRKVSTWIFADTIIPTILIGQAIGRWGNFFNHEVYGMAIQIEHVLSEADKTFSPDSSGPAFTHFWGFLKQIMPHVWSNMWIYKDNNVAFYVPIFLIESFFNVILFIVWYFIIEMIKGYRAGTLCFGYFLSTGIVRLIIEIFRDDQFKFQTSIITSALFIVFGFLGIVASYLLFPRLRKYRCVYFVYSKIWIHSAAIWIYIIKSIKRLNQKHFSKIKYQDCFNKFDKKRYYQYTRTFWDYFYYNDNVILKPYVLS